MSEQRPELIIVNKEALAGNSEAYCQLDAEGHCITCSDEALPARILDVDQQAGTARVAIRDATEEIDITLVDDVASGDEVLVHGGVAIARL
jgi:hydrogenase maturation factor